MSSMRVKVEKERDHPEATQTKHTYSSFPSTLLEMYRFLSFQRWKSWEIITYQMA